MEVLSTLGMKLHNCGGPNDRGVDLQVELEWRLLNRVYGHLEISRFHFMFNVKILHIVLLQWYL